MTCNEAADLLSAWHDGELAGEQARAVAAHVETCAACRSELVAMKEDHAALSRLFAPDADAISRAARRAVPSRPRAWSGRRTWLPLGAVAAALLAFFVGEIPAPTPPPVRNAYTWTPLAGAPAVERVDRANGPNGGARPGDVVTTSESARAELRIADIGSVVVDPGSRVKIVDTGEQSHQLFLERGTIHASIFAAPRRFQVGTPSGLAVDLGCKYSLTVDAAGAATIGVKTGRVSFEAEHRRVLVPAGASCVAHPGLGPVAPVWDDAPEEIRAFGRNATPATISATLLEPVLRVARPRDTLTLFHLLRVADTDLRVRVYDRLAVLSPPPAGVLRADCLALDEDSLERWLAYLEWSWW